MSGFDDLLKQSSRALEENPFEDPFARPRASSPDPWSTYTHQSAALDSPAPSAVESHAFIAPTIPSDPLDSANLPADDETEHTTKPTTSPRFSSFTERIETVPPSIPSQPSADSSESVPESEPPRAARPTLPSITSAPMSPSVQPSSPVTPSSAVPTDSVEHTDPPSPPPPSSARLPQRQEAPHSSIHVPFDSSSSTESDSHHVISSPLDQPPVTAFASLALGGESFNGWDGEQSAFVNHSSIPSFVQEEHDDDDDDKPLRPRPTFLLQTTPTDRKETGLQSVFAITVEDPQKVGDPIRAFIMYTVHTKTTSPAFSKPSFSVLRRYSDFLWLYEALSLNNPGVVVPPVPEKSPFGRFDDQFVQHRRTALENCINKIANHPVLCKDADLRLFLESDTFSLDIKQRKAEMANERGGLMASIGQSITGPRFVETDEWFDRQKAHLEVLESQLRGLVKAIEAVSKHRSELASAVGEFAQTVSDLASSDLGKSVSHSLEALAELERKAQETESTQARADQATLLSTADEYARLVNSVRMAFSSRVRVYHAWQNADADLRRVKQAHERNRAQGKAAVEKGDRHRHSYSQIGEAERRVLDAKQEFEQVSRLVKSEVARFEQERIEDFKKSLEDLLDGMIARQKETIQAREAFQQVLLKKVPQTGSGTRGNTITSTA
ncbi:Vps5 C terminal like-domain-containing protein [Russula aff. rugulosa BPL654]|nr:Vps5 C terminal like-domain-containing protein [Russula aff. rugulosa BPL654]